MGGGLRGRPGWVCASSLPLPSREAQAAVPSLGGGRSVLHRTPNPEAHWIPASCHLPHCPPPPLGGHWMISLSLQLQTSPPVLNSDLGGPSQVRHGHHEPPAPVTFPQTGSCLSPGLRSGTGLLQGMTWDRGPIKIARTDTHVPMHGSPHPGCQVHRQALVLPCPQQRDSSGWQ